MESLAIELAKHGPLAILLGGVLWVGSRILERQLEIANAQRNKEIEASIKAAEKELEILEARHNAASLHEQKVGEESERQSGLLERISRALEGRVNSSFNSVR
jgi:hypothetical protein